MGEFPHCRSLLTVAVVPIFGPLNLIFVAIFYIFFLQNYSTYIFLTFLPRKKHKRRVVKNGEKIFYFFKKVIDINVGASAVIVDHPRPVPVLFCRPWVIESVVISTNPKSIY